jgi:hypothetical protein
MIGLICVSVFCGFVVLVMGGSITQVEKKEPGAGLIVWLYILTAILALSCSVYTAYLSGGMK